MSQSELCSSYTVHNSQVMSLKCKILEQTFSAEIEFHKATRAGICSVVVVERAKLVNL
jgi:hypothetical protein